MVDKLVVMEKGDLKRKAEDDVGDWDTALFDAWITNKKTLQRIRFYYCRNHPCQEIPDGLEKRSTRHLRVYHCPQFSMASVGKRRKNPCLDDDAMSFCSLSTHRMALCPTQGGRHDCVSGAGLDRVCGGRPTYLA